MADKRLTDTPEVLLRRALAEDPRFGREGVDELLGAAASRYQSGVLEDPLLAWINKQERPFTTAGVCNGPGKGYRRDQVSHALIRLSRSGRVELVERGRGRVPSVYRRKEG